MPVTAKLLRRFYETFGQELTTELVDWANEMDTGQEVRMNALAERYFQRFDERLERRMAELRAELIKWMFTLWAGSAVTTVATVWGVVSLLKS